MIIFKYAILEYSGNHSYEEMNDDKIKPYIYQ